MPCQTLPNPNEAMKITMGRNDRIRWRANSKRRDHDSYDDIDGRNWPIVEQSPSLRQDWTVGNNRRYSFIWLPGHPLLWREFSGRPSFPCRWALRESWFPGPSFCLRTCCNDLSRWSSHLERDWLIDWLIDFTAQYVHSSHLANS